MICFLASSGLENVPAEDLKSSMVILAGLAIVAAALVSIFRKGKDLPQPLQIQKSEFEHFRKEINSLRADAAEARKSRAIIHEKISNQGNALYLLAGKMTGHDRDQLVAILEKKEGKR